MGRTKNQVQKPAKVHQLKGGQWAALVTLVQPRWLEGKMRSGRHKFERQTEPLANALCAEINALLFDKELARQLSKHEVEIAKKVFWEILEPRHPEWLDHLTDIISHAEKTGFRPPKNDFPTISEAARIFYREYVSGLEKESRLNYRYMIAYLLPPFGHLKPYEMTDQQILELAYGTEPVKFMHSSVKPYSTQAEADAHLWDTLKDSKTKRPWTFHFTCLFLKLARGFRNWMHESKDPVTQKRRNWCFRSTIEVPQEPRSLSAPKANITANSELAAADPECFLNPALTIPQTQALLDVAWVAFDGKFAPFYVHGFFCGSRAKEISRTDVLAFNSQDGVLAVSDDAAKTDQGRESEVYPNTIAMVEALRSAGLYTRMGFRPDRIHRTVIHILAGFTSNVKHALARAERERKRLETRGIILPKRNWGIPFPKNALRRTALSMHYKLFLNAVFTTAWAGNSPGVFKDFYKRLVTKEQARQYWTMLPTWFQARGKIAVELPKGHKLDSAITENVRTTVSAACEAMSALKQDVDAAIAAQSSAGLAKSKSRARMNSSTGDSNNRRTEGARSRRTTAQPPHSTESELCEVVA